MLPAFFCMLRDSEIASVGEEGMVMAQQQDDYQLISVSGDEDEVVFHAGLRREPSPESDTSVQQSAPAQTTIAAPPPHADRNDPTAYGEPSAEKATRVPVTAEERQRERRRAQYRQQAAEIAATEADLEKAGHVGKGQMAIIICCLVLLVVIVSYVVWTFAA